MAQMRIVMTREMKAAIQGQPTFLVNKAIRDLAQIDSQALLRAVIARRLDGPLDNGVTVYLRPEEAAMLVSMDRKLGTRNKSLVVRTGLARLLETLAA